MTRSLRETLSHLPPIPPEDIARTIRAEIRRQPDHKVVVLDDDPTGTQTVHDVPVLTTWDIAALAEEFAADAPGFYVLTNSRSLGPTAARDLNLEIARNLHRAAGDRTFSVISRSDSTLRGHFPVETDALSEVLGPFDVTVLIPYFEAGGRYTIDDVHYVAQGDELVPAAETPFARDASFGYSSSNLRHWVEEKTAGRVRATDVHSISIAALRQPCRRGAPTPQDAGWAHPSHIADSAHLICERLRALRRGSYCIVNAAHPRDVERFAAGALRAEQAGVRLLYRTAAQFVAGRLGIEPRPLLTVADFNGTASATHGGLVVVGSHVPQSTAQLTKLLESPAIARVELPVARLLETATREIIVRAAAIEIDGHLRAGRDAVVFTSRELVAGHDANESLQISACVSRAVVQTVAALEVTPRFLVAKGGITSSDVATKAARVRRALVRGQILPGVPVWRLGAESRFPGLDYVVFPGNVGGPGALAEVCRILSRSTR